MSDIGRARADMPTLTEHLRTVHSSGDGYTAPQEEWITCSCGSLVWDYYQGSGTNPPNTVPDEAWEAHVAGRPLKEDETDER